MAESVSALKKINGTRLLNQKLSVCDRTIAYWKIINNKLNLCCDYSSDYIVLCVFSFLSLISHQAFFCHFSTSPALTRFFVGNAFNAQPMILIYHRLKARHLSSEFSRYWSTLPYWYTHFKLVNHTFLMIGTETWFPCQVVQLGGALRLKKPAEPNDPN